MPLASPVISEKAEEEETVFTRRDLLSIVFSEIREYAFHEQEANKYVTDLVTVPARRLALRKEYEISDTLAEALAIHVSLRMISYDAVTYVYSSSKAVLGMRLKDSYKEGYHETFIAFLEKSSGENEWLDKLVRNYLEKRNRKESQ